MHLDGLLNTYSTYLGRRVPAGRLSRAIEAEVQVLTNCKAYASLSHVTVDLWPGPSSKSFAEKCEFLLIHSPLTPFPLRPDTQRAMRVQMA